MNEPTNQITTQPPLPPRKSWPRRHKVATAFIGVGTLIVLFIILAAIGASTTTTTGNLSTAASSSSPAAPPTTAAPPPPPATPNVQGQGSCDVSLSSSLNGPDYLTATVNLTNTGGAATAVTVTVEWPQQGFPPITKTKHLTIAQGGSATVNLHVPVNTQQVGQFQDVQLNTTGDPCKYDVSVG